MVAQVDRLVRPASPDHQAVVAEEGGSLIAVASFERRPVDTASAEFALYVDESHRGRGVGTLLLEHLAARARKRGVTELVGEVLPTNAGMLRMAHDLGGHPSFQFDDGVVDVRLRTRQDEGALAIADARDRIAATASLRPLPAPRVVAVVGAGRTPGGIGSATLESIREYGFTGSPYAVNPHATNIGGVPAYPSVSAIPEQVDLVVISVPAPGVADVLADAGKAGVRAAVVLSSGFGEVGGGESQAELVRIARRHGIRVVGPNCLGVLNSDPAVRLGATFSPVLPPAGGLALASQSGAIGIAVLAADAAEAAGLTVPAASAALAAWLDEVIPGAGNPLDLGAGATPEAFAVALELLCSSGEADAVMVVVAATRANDVGTVLSRIAPVADRHRDLPIAAVVLGAPAPTSVGERRRPVFDLPERAVAALAKAARYEAWRREPLGYQPELSDVDTLTAQGVVRGAVARGRGWQPHGRIVDILGRYGIPVVPTITAVGARAAVAAATKLGYPAVLKAADPDLVHKSDLGAVRLRLADPSAVEAAYAEIATATGRPEPVVLVQPMAAGQVELVAGIVHDRLFGSLVMAGLVACIRSCSPTARSAWSR